METRGKRKVYYDPDSDEDGRERGDRAADQPLRNSSAAGSAGPSKQSKTRHEETDADEHEDDKLSEEALKKQLKTVTDEREIKRIKRLLRNRVSAQQARERKKQYVSELEQKLQVKDDHITRLSRDLRRAATTNATLRRLIQTMRPGSATPVPPVVGHAVASSEHPPGGSSDGSGGATSDGAGVAPVPTGEPIGPLNGWNSGLDMAARAEQTGLGGRVAAPGSQQCPLRSGAVSPPQPQPSGSKHVAAHEFGPRLIPVSAASAPGQVGAPAGMQEWMGMGVPGMCPDPRPELCGQAWQVHSSRPGEG